MAKRIGSVIAIVAAVILLWRSAFIVDEGQIALRTRFGQIAGAPCGPGLNFKSPFDDAHIFDQRVLSRAYQGESFLTRDEKPLLVDFYIKWKLMDALRFYQTSNGDEEMAALRLADSVRDHLKTAVAAQSLSVISTAPRGTLSEAAFAELQQSAQTLGLNLVDVQVQRVELTDEVATAVYQRMQQSLIAKAQQLRASGTADAEKIRADAERKRAEILGDATRQSQHLRGEADGQAAAALARAYGRNAEFAAFYRAMQAYQKSLGRDGDILVISPEGEFFKYLHSASGR